MIQHNYLYENSNLHVFSEETYYNEANPDLTNFGFEIIIDWKGMKNLLYILIKGGEFIAKDRNWSRKFSFNKANNTLTQVYTKPRQKEETIETTYLTDDEIKQLCKSLSETYNDLYSEVILKRKEKNAKIAASVKKALDTVTETHPESTKEEKVEE